MTKTLDVVLQGIASEAKLNGKLLHDACVMLSNSKDCGNMVMTAVGPAIMLMQKEDIHKLQVACGAIYLAGRSMGQQELMALPEPEYDDSYDDAYDDEHDSGDDL